MGDLLFCCFASRIPVGSIRSMKLQLQLAKATFCRWILWGFTGLGKSGRGRRWWLFPQSQPFGFSCPCFCGSCTLFLGVSHFFSWQKLEISAGFPVHHGTLFSFDSELTLMPVGVALLCVTCWLGISVEPLEEEEDSGTNVLQESNYHILSLDILQPYGTISREI